MDFFIVFPAYAGGDPNLARQTESEFRFSPRMRGVILT